MSDALSILLRSAATEIEAMNTPHNRDPEAWHVRADNLLVEALERIAQAGIPEAADLAKAWRDKSSEWWWS